MRRTFLVACVLALGSLGQAAPASTADAITASRAQGSPLQDQIDCAKLGAVVWKARGGGKPSRPNGYLTHYSESRHTCLLAVHIMDAGGVVNEELDDITQGQPARGNRGMFLGQVGHPVYVCVIGGQRCASADFSTAKGVYDSYVRKMMQLP